MQAGVYSFTFYSLLCFFMLYTLLGWCIEVVFCSVNTGKFVNRGFLNGPVCPIYGFGAILVIWILFPFSGNLWVLFLGSVLVTSALELGTGFILKTLFHTRWWDYSKQRFNLGGYISLKFSLVWGLACLVLVRFIHPLFARLINIIPLGLGVVVLCVFYATFICDFIVTLAAMLKLNRDLGEITRVAEGLHRGSEALAETLGNGALYMADKIEGFDVEAGRQMVAGKLENGKEIIAATAAQGRARVDAALAENREKIQDTLATAAAGPQLEKLLGRNSRIRRRLLKAFPHAQCPPYQGAMQQMRDHLLPPGQNPRASEGQQDDTAQGQP